MRLSFTLIYPLTLAIFLEVFIMLFQAVSAKSPVSKNEPAQIHTSSSEIYIDQLINVSAMYFQSKKPFQNL
jgi:hypothetical protein